MTRFRPPALRRLTAVATGLVLLAAGLATAPAASADRLDTLLTVGERLEQGDSLVSPNGRIRLQLDHFGGLKLIDRGDRSGGYPAEYVVDQYNSYDPGSQVSYVVLQSDGNLVGYGSGGRAVVNFRTNGSGATAVRVQDDRNVVFTDGSSRVVRATGTNRRLYVGRSDFLLAGDTVLGERGVSRLTMQGDGNLVLYRGSTPLWNARTAGNPGAYAFMQGDGNFVVYSSPATGNRPLFDSGTGQGSLTPVELVVEDTEISVNYLLNGSAHAPKLPMWASNWASSRVASGDEMDEGDMRTSPNGRCSLSAQQSVLLLVCDDEAVWTTRAPSPYFIPGAYGVSRMQADGNLVGYRFAEGTTRVIDVPYNTRTSVPGSYLVVQDDRNVVVRAPDGRPTWSRLTGPIR